MNLPHYFLLQKYLSNIRCGNPKTRQLELIWGSLSAISLPPITASRPTGPSTHKYLTNTNINSNMNANTNINANTNTNANENTNADVNTLQIKKTSADILQMQKKSQSKECDEKDVSNRIHHLA